MKRGAPEMDQKTETSKVTAQDALAILDEAWAYYTPEEAAVEETEEPELFQYHAAA